MLKGIDKWLKVVYTPVMTMKRQAAKKKGTDIKSFAIFLVVCGVVVAIATYPWIIAVAAGLGILLYVTNPKVKAWVNSKIMKKKEKKQ